MSNRNTKLTRRRLLGGLATIGAASAAVGAGTMAYFTDSEPSTGNTVQAGTLDLKLDGSDTTVPFLNAQDIAPGESDSGDVKLENSGSLDGTVEIEIDSIQDRDRNGGDGQLDEYLLVRAELGAEEVIAETTVQNLSTGPLTISNDTVTSQSSKRFTLYWDLPSSTPNQAQGDSVQIDFTFRLVQ